MKLNLNTLQKYLIGFVLVVLLYDTIAIIVEPPKIKTTKTQYPDVAHDSVSYIIRNDTAIIIIGKAGSFVQSGGTNTAIGYPAITNGKAIYIDTLTIHKNGKAINNKSRN